MGEVKATTAQRFHGNLLDLVDLTISTVAWLQTQGITSLITPGKLSFARIIIAGWSPDDSIKGFITRSATYWEQIRNKDLEFLTLNANVLFGELNMPDYVKAFGELFGSKRPTKDANGGVVMVPAIAPETLDSIWGFLQAMVRICIRHIHEKRVAKLVPVDEMVNGQVTKVMMSRYTEDFFPEISVRKQVDLWKLTL